MNPINSMILIEMLKELSTEVTTKTLPYLLILDASDETLSHLKYGLKRKNSPYTAYWPDQESWLKKARANACLKSYLSESKDSGLFELLDCCPSSADQITSLENQIVSIFDAIFEKRYSADIDVLKNMIVTLLIRFDVPQQDIEDIRILDNYLQVARYLVAKAKNNRGSVILSKRQMEENVKLRRLELEKVQEREKNGKQSLEFCSYFELNKKGLSAMDIAGQLLRNDAKLYGSDVLGSNAGTAKQWASEIVAAPGNWNFLCDGAEIIGNWSYTYLSPKEEESVRSGAFAEENFSLDTVNYPLMAPDREVVVYLLNISLNDGYQTDENWERIWKNFGSRIRHLMQLGITVKRIYGNLYRDDHKAIFRRMGFRWLARNRISGDIYCLDLNQADNSGFGWIMDQHQKTDEMGAEKDITFHQLSEDDILEEQQLMDIAGLIYDTDPYIYPQMFSRRQAKRILPFLFAENKDRMFSLNNIFCAMVGHRIVGIILHKTGPLNWDSSQLVKYAKLLGEPLTDTLAMVEKEYFREYDSTPDDATAILNCCVNSNYRMRNDIRLGTRMMKAFVASHPERLELYVLQETPAAMRLYLRAGFMTTENDMCNGFSVDHRELPCFFMYRLAR